MNDQRQTHTRRADIDGLRAIAVLVVIFFHLGCLQAGYLGVDVFFVISGFLIIGIIYNEVVAGGFSLYAFYVRRIRRIIPLVLISELVSLLVGLLVMLPDDLENLAQSVFATSIFANNILLNVTSGNYWSLPNDYKPLMHTWSLGVEEQFYFLIPLLFIVLKKQYVKLAIPLLVVLSSFSLWMFLLSKDPGSCFYLLPYRFFELGVGGVAAVLTREGLVKTRHPVFQYVALISLLILPLPIPNTLRLLAVVVVSGALLATDKGDEWISTRVFQNRIMVWIGRISFSLYMWHQIILAFARYCVVDKFDTAGTCAFFCVLIIVSAVSYYVIERPFQNSKMINVKSLFVITGGLFLIAVTGSLYIYAIAGIVRSVPELGVEPTAKLQNFGSSRRNTHIEYNARVYDFDRPFSEDGTKIKVFVVGNSFARDFANILLESRYRDRIDVSYKARVTGKCDNVNNDKRFREADIIVFSEQSVDEITALSVGYGFDMEKVWCVGTKNFGINNGCVYNKKHDSEYALQRTAMKPGVLAENDDLKRQWSGRYIDLISSVVDENGRVPVFTPTGMFFSQDCDHLTREGAVELAKRIDLDSVFGSSCRQ